MKNQLLWLIDKKQNNTGVCVLCLPGGSGQNTVGPSVSAVAAGGTAGVWERAPGRAFGAVSRRAGLQPPSGRRAALSPGPVGGPEADGRQ